MAAKKPAQVSGIGDQPGSQVSGAGYQEEESAPPSPDTQNPIPDTPEGDVIFEPAPAFEAAVEETEAEPAATAPAEPEEKPRWEWEATSGENRQAEHGDLWQVRVARGGGDGLWRPLVEYTGDGYKTERGAEAALERLLR